MWCAFHSQKMRMLLKQENSENSIRWSSNYYIFCHGFQYVILQLYIQIDMHGLELFFNTLTDEMGCDVCLKINVCFASEIYYI